MPEQNNQDYRLFNSIFTKFVILDKLSNLVILKRHCNIWELLLLSNILRSRTFQGHVYLPIPRLPVLLNSQSTTSFRAAFAMWYYNSFRIISTSKTLFFRSTRLHNTIINANSFTSFITRKNPFLLSHSVWRSSFGWLLGSLSRGTTRTTLGLGVCLAVNNNH